MDLVFIPLLMEKLIKDSTTTTKNTVTGFTLGLMAKNIAAGGLWESRMAWESSVRAPKTNELSSSAYGKRVKKLGGLPIVKLKRSRSVREPLHQSRRRSGSVAHTRLQLISTAWLLQFLNKLV
jgi:hypothetical protein